jgi:hypothetical protein
MDILKLKLENCDFHNERKGKLIDISLVTIIAPIYVSNRPKEAELLHRWACLE